MIRVFQYGAIKPIQAELVVNQMRQANHYYNKLIAIERDRREKVAAALNSAEVEVLTAEIDKLDAEAEAIAKAAKARRAEARARVDVSADAGQVKALREKMKGLRAQRKEAKERGKTPDVLALIEAINAASNERKKEERGLCGIPHGTYLAIENSVMQASKSITPPSFRKWDGHGQVGVQYREPVDVAEVVDRTDSRWFQIHVLPVERDSNKARRNRRAVAWLRVGSDAKREPVWIQIPFVFSRPLPEGATIRLVYLHRKMIADHEQWRLNITLDIPDVEVKRTTDMVCGVDLGWRKLDHGIRVAVAVGSDGHVDELVMPNALVSKFQHVASLRSIRDIAFNAVKVKFMAFLASPACPETLREACQHADKWRSFARMVWVFRSWARFVGDEEIFPAVRGWFHQDRHLWQWEAHEHVKCVNRRRELYETWAKALACRYGVVGLEDMRLDVMARRPGLGEKEAIEAASRARMITAVGELRETIESEVKKVGGLAVRTKTALTTRTCHACGVINDFDAATELETSCVACDATWDQDVNAGMNLLTQAENAVRTKVEPVVVKTASAWSRRKAEKQMAAV